MNEKLIIKMTDEILFECSLYPAGAQYDDKVAWKLELVHLVSLEVV